MLALFLPLLLAAPQRPPEPFASYTVPTQQVATSPNDACVAIVSNAIAIRIDARSQRVEELAERGHVAAIALGDDSYALGLHDGRIVHLDANGTRAEFVARKGHAVLGLQRHGDHIAWWTDDRKANVLDLKNGAQRFDPPLEVASHQQFPVVRFAADGRFVCLRQQSDRPEAAAFVAVRDLKDGAEVACLPCYSSHGDDFVLAGSRVVHARRLDTKTWNLLAFDLDARASKVLDADLRGGHFVDLLAAPSGRFVVEGDFEEPGLARYGFAGADAARAEFAGELRAVGCGRLRVGGEPVEVLFAVARREPGELMVFRFDDRTRVAGALPGAGPLDGVGTFAHGLGLWRCEWVGAGASRTRRMQFFSLEGETRRR